MFKVPSFGIANYFAGFFIFLYIVVPIFYWSNTYDAQMFPFYTSQTLDHAGHTEKDFDINLDAYKGYSKLYVSLMFALLYGLSFGTFIWGMWKKNYQAVPLIQIRAALPFHPPLSILVLIEFAISGKWQPCNNVYAEIMFWLSRRRRFPSGVWSQREHDGKYVLNSSNDNLMISRSYNI
ncbi:unnamed protein product [Brassica rapa]|uniref:Uncharacterized protein n=1 Tax=Brassica campestris TaxID=3711 RepID=A0A8D9HX66_BRACM|nr:unnamed protein product [Brassica rapa]